MPPHTEVIATPAAAQTGADGALKDATTTISTIVVRAAPHTTIVIGILESLGFVQLRIDEMKPCLLDLGSNLVETTRLIDEHKDLCTRLNSKQIQVDDLLSCADRLAVTQTTEGDALVYAAMARGLAHAWRELMRQLELRGALLEDTRRLFELVIRHENAVERTNALIRDTVNATRVSVDDVNLNTALEQIKQSVNGLATLTAEAADVGTQIIIHTRALGQLADNENRPREIADACADIESVMLNLANDWENVDALWSDEREKFARLKAMAVSAALESSKVSDESGDANSPAAQLSELAAWLDAARQTYTTTTATASSGDETRHTVQALLHEASQRKLQLDSEEFSCLAVFRDDLRREYDEFCAKLNVDDRVAQFLVGADSVLNQLEKMAAELRATDASASMAGELGPLAYQKADAQINEGESILRLDALRADNTAEARDRVNDALKQLRAALAHVDALAREKIKVAKSANAKIQAQISLLTKWLAESVESLLTSRSYGTLGVDRAACAEFIARHKLLSSSIIAHEPELHAVLGHAPKLAAADRRHCAELQRNFENARYVLDARLTLAHDFEQFQKFARDVDASLNTMEQLIDAPASNDGTNTIERMLNLQQTVREAIQREKHYGDKFLSAAQFIGERDAHLRWAECGAHVDSTIHAHESRFTQAVARVETWQGAQNDARNALSLIDEVTVWESHTQQLIQRVEQSLLRFAPLAVATAPVDSARELRTLALDDFARADFQHSLIDAIERCSQMNRKTVEACELVYAVTAAGVVLPPTAHDFVAAQRATVTANEPFATLQIRLVRLCDELRKQNAALEIRLKELENDSEKPHFTRQLQNLTVTEGASLTVLECTIAGKPEPKVIWFKEEECVRESDRIQLRFVDDHCALEIRNVTVNDAGLYKVRAVNPIGECVNFCRLNVLPSSSTRRIPPPTMPKSAPPTDGASLIGDTIFSSTYEEHTVHQVPGLESYNQSELSVREYDSAQPQQLYFYRSEAPPAAANVSSAAPLPRQFLQSPYVTSSPSRELGDMGYSSIANAPEFIRPFCAEYTIDEGDRAVIDCLLVGNPRPRVYWTFNNRPLKSNHQFVELTNIGDTYSIHFAPARLEHAGYYRMSAENIRGGTESVTLVHIRPRSMIPQPTFAGRAARKTHSLEQQRMLHEFERYGTSTSDHYRSALKRAASAMPTKRFSPAGYGGHTHVEDYSSRLMSTSDYQPKNIFSPEYGDNRYTLQQDLSSATNWRRSDAGINSYYQPQRIQQQIMDQPQQQPRTTSNVQYERSVEQTIRYEQQNQEDPTNIPSEKFDRVKSTTAKSATQESLQRGEDAEPPHFKRTLVSGVVCAGESAKFEAVVSGKPQPQIEWFKNGETLSAANDANGAQISTQPSADGRVALTFACVAPADAGKYMCVAQNAHGMATSSAQLVVRPKTVAPDFLQRLISEEIMEGERLKWTVKIVGDPRPRVVWLRDDQPIPNCDDVRLVQEALDEYSMIIERVEAADAGQFTCMLENEAGEARSTADLVVRPAGSEPGSYFHITKVTQEKQLKSEEISQNEAICVEEPPLQSETVNSP